MGRYDNLPFRTCQIRSWRLPAPPMEQSGQQASTLASYYNFIQIQAPSQPTTRPLPMETTPVAYMELQLRQPGRSGSPFPLSMSSPVWTQLHTASFTTAFQQPTACRLVLSSAKITPSGLLRLAATRSVCCKYKRQLKTHRSERIRQPHASFDPENESSAFYQEQRANRHFPGVQALQYPNL